MNREFRSFINNHLYKLRVGTVLLILSLLMGLLTPNFLYAESLPEATVIDEHTSLILSEENAYYHLPPVDGFQVDQLDLYSLYTLVRTRSPMGTIDYFRSGAEERIELGSITQIMTYYVVLQFMEENKLAYSTRLPVSAEDIARAQEYSTSTAGFLPGDEPTIEELLNTMIVRAAGEAIFALIRGVAGDEMLFVQRMNEEAAKLGMLNSHFTDPIGLSKLEGYTSLDDIALVLDLLMEDEKFKDMMRARRYATGPLKSNPDGFTIYTIMGEYAAERQLNIDSIEGAKTGSTTRSGFSLVSFYELGQTDIFLLTARAKEAGQEIADHLYLQEKMRNIPYTFPLLAKGLVYTQVDVVDEAGKKIGTQGIVTEENFARRLPLWTDLGGYGHTANVTGELHYPLEALARAGDIRIFHTTPYTVDYLHELNLVLPEEEFLFQENIHESSTSETAQTSALPTAEVSSNMEVVEEPREGQPYVLHTVLRVLFYVLIVCALGIAVLRIIRGRKRRAVEARKKQERLDAIRRKYKK